MRIAQLTYSTRPRGGVVHTLALSEALARRGAEVTVYCLGRGGDHDFYRRVDPAVTVRVVPFPLRDDEDVGARIDRSISVLRAALTRELSDQSTRGQGYHIVHAQDCITANAALGVAPVVRTIHHLDSFATPQLVRCHERAVVEPAARICVSAAVADEVHAGWGFVPTVIPNGVDAARFALAASDEPNAVAARTAFGEKFGRYVVSVGGIEPRKGSLDLLDAFAVVKQSLPDLSLVIAGGETLFDYRDYRAEFDRRAMELGIAPVFLGQVPDETLPALVAGAVAFPFLSTKEGFGLAAMEALAAGVPVVARDLPVLREVFGGVVRFASDPESMAAALVDAIVDGQRFRAAGQERAALYRWDNAAAAHLEFYRTVLHQPAWARG